MNKKTLYKIAVASFICAGVMMMGGCDGLVNPQTHSHNYTQATYTVVEDKAYVTNKCGCGHSITRVIPNAIIATPSTAQNILDGNIDGKVVVFTSEENNREYDEILRLRPSRGEHDKILEKTSTNWQFGEEIELANIENSKYYAYFRTIENAKFVATEEVVFKNLFMLEAGITKEGVQLYNGKFDAVKNLEMSSSDYYYANTSLKNVEITNLKFEGMHGRIYMFMVSPYANINNLKIDSCDFSTEEAYVFEKDRTQGASICIHNASDSLINDVVVNNCNSKGHFQGIYLSGATNAIVENSVFSNTANRSIFVTHQTNAKMHGDIIIRNNIVNNASNISISAGSGENSNIIIDNNVINNTNKYSNDWPYMMQLLASVNTSYVVSNNTYNGNKVTFLTSAPTDYDWFYIYIPGYSAVQGQA